jgi:hypothetical protein
VWQKSLSITCDVVRGRHSESSTRGSREGDISEGRDRDETLRNLYFTLLGGLQGFKIYYLKVLTTVPSLSAHRPRSPNLLSVVHSPNTHYSSLPDLDRLHHEQHVCGEAS